MSHTPHEYGLIPVWMPMCDLRPPVFEKYCEQYGHEYRRIACIFRCSRSRSMHRWSKLNKNVFCLPVLLFYRVLSLHTFMQKFFVTNFTNEVVFGCVNGPMSLESFFSFEL